MAALSKKSQHDIEETGALRRDRRSTPKISPGRWKTRRRRHRVGSDRSRAWSHRERGERNRATRPSETRGGRPAVDRSIEGLTRVRESMVQIAKVGKEVGKTSRRSRRRRPEQIMPERRNPALASTRPSRLRAREKRRRIRRCGRRDSANLAGPFGEKRSRTSRDHQGAATGGARGSRRRRPTVRRASPRKSEELCCDGAAGLPAYSRRDRGRARPRAADCSRHRRAVGVRPASGPPSWRRPRGRQSSSAGTD